MCKSTDFWDYVQDATADTLTCRTPKSKEKKGKGRDEGRDRGAIFFTLMYIQSCF
jgi:hypothetical protein